MHFADDKFHTLARPLLAALVVLFGSFGPARGQDVLVVGSVSLAEPGEQLVLPIYLRDVDGTALDGNDGPGRTIQSLALTLRATPPGAVDSATLARAGVALDATPIFETQVEPPDRRTLLMTFDEAGDPLPSTTGAPHPGDLIAELTITIANEFDADTIELHWLRTITALGNQEGSVVETHANGQLTLIDGGVLVDSSGIFVDGFESGDTSAW